MPLDTTIAELPPTDLRVRVAGTDDPEWFVSSGKASIEDLKRGLAATGRRLEDFHTILEWGCGCGRILLPLQGLGLSAELHGCDIDAEAIAWLSARAPGVKAVVNQGLPPLPYADATFDLVYNHSVLSHLDETYQDAWLGELRRVTKPGGIVTLSIHGDFAFRYRMGLPHRTRDEAVAHIAAMEKDGLVFIKDPPGTKRPFPDYYHQTYHSTAYVFRHWHRWFDIVAYLPAGALGLQDLVVLRRFEGERATDMTKAAAWPAPPPPPAEPGLMVRIRNKAKRTLKRLIRRPS